MANVDTAINLTETNLKQLVYETGTLVTPVAFTSDTSNNDTETLVITPSKGCRKLVVIINENNASTGGTLTVNVAAGSFWAGKAMTEVEIAVSTSKAFVFEGAKHLGNKSGVSAVDADEAKIQILVAPANGKKLATNHGATWQVFQLP